MNVQIQSIKFDADRKLLDFVQSKLDKLDRFNDAITSAEVILKLDKDHENGNKVATIKLNVPGEALLAERRSHSFEESIDEVYEALKSQISKYKDK